MQVPKKLKATISENIQASDHEGELLDSTLMSH
jgi:hypothetical protein